MTGQDGSYLAELLVELTELIADVVGFTGRVEWDTTRPDGTPRKLLSSEKIRALGWNPKTTLREGIADAYQDYQRSVDKSCAA